MEKLQLYFGKGIRLAMNMFRAMLCVMMIGQSWAQTAKMEPIKQLLDRYHSTIKGIDLFALSINEPAIQFSKGEPPATAAFQQRVLSGAAAGDEFGMAVSAAGDFDGDGFDDFIIGAHQNDGAGTNGGRVYLYLGGHSFDAIADLVLSGEAAADQFGRSVASAGDVNGDGFDDIVVGARLHDGNGFDAGRAYLYFGGPSLDHNPDVILDGEIDGDEFGVSVASAGDVNSDGFADIIVGAWFSNAGAAAAGRAYVYFGDPEMDSVPDLILTGSGVADQFGVSVGGAGDLNDDGHDDVVVGAWFRDAGAVDAGAALVFFGGPGMDNAADVTLTGESLADLFGAAVKGGGDVNGDGVSDLIVGGVLNDVGGVDAGRTYIYFGGSEFDNTPDVVLTGVASGDHFGNAVSNQADINGDGYHDILVAAFNHDAGGTNAGRVYVYFGGPAIDNVADAIFTGEHALDQYGTALGAAGDVNGDGLADFLVGVPGHDGAGANAGRAFLYLNSMTGSDIRDDSFYGEAFGDLFGFSVALVRDVNADGFDDVVVGAPGNKDGGSLVGKVSIFFGGQIDTALPDWTATGEASGDLFGISVAEAGDVNGDSYHDLIIGAAGSSGAAPHAGRAFVYFGGPGFDNAADLVLNGEGTMDLFGSSVSSAGDLNGDGFGDFLVGASENDAGGTNAGRAYLYFGGPRIDNKADLVLTGASPGENFGVDVSAAGDVNGDGFGDIIIGAWASSDSDRNPGHAYVFFGGTVMDATADLVLSGQNFAGMFGVSVTSAGDVNRDGFADVLVGAHKDDTAGEQTGRAYLYFGGISPDGLPDIVLTGERAGDEFGMAVSPAGDLNRDGYGDIIVGAAKNDAGGTNAGRAYVYFGGASMDDKSDVILTNDEKYAAFGFLVAGGRDINGDGLQDLIVGAPLGSGIVANAGRVDMFLNSAPSVVPRMMSAEDVPHDQGGSLTLRWARSGYDAAESGRVVTYMIQRSLPPDLFGFTWENIGSITATRDPFYSFTAETLFDSSEATDGLHFFRVIARGTHPDELWKAFHVPGYSVDNLAPSSVQNLEARLAPDGSVRLVWQQNERDLDIARHEVYRAKNENFLPNDDLQIGVSTDTFFVDLYPDLISANYYGIVTVDYHGNRSQPSFATLTLTLIDEAEIVTPDQFSLTQNFPNPFNPTTTIQFALPTRANVTLTLHDVLGSEIAILVDKAYNPGLHQYLFDASDFPSGVYIYQIQIGKWQQRRKMILLK